MADLDQTQERVEELIRRHKRASERKSKMKGQLEEKKKELVKLKREIEAAGLDPKNLKAEKARLEEELEKTMNLFEQELSQVESALDEYES